MTSGVDFIFFIELVKEFFLKFFHGIVFIIDLDEVHRKSGILFGCVDILFALYELPELFHIYRGSIFIRQKLILIETILCEVFKGGLPAFHSFKLLILGKLVLINPLFSIELQN